MYNQIQRFLLTLGMNKKYHINLFYSDEDQAWVADIPDLFVCSATGDTPEEALHEVLIGQRLWLELAEKEGKTIPEPHYKPEDASAGIDKIYTKLA